MKKPAKAGFFYAEHKARSTKKRLIERESQPPAW
jgi:hypothetical protein